MRTPWRIFSDLRLRKRTRLDPIEPLPNSDLQALDDHSAIEGDATASQNRLEFQQVADQVYAKSVPPAQPGFDADAGGHEAGETANEKAVDKIVGKAGDLEDSELVPENGAVPALSVVDDSEESIAEARVELLASVALPIEILEPPSDPATIGIDEVERIEATPEPKVPRLDSAADNPTSDVASISHRRARRPKTAKAKALKVEQPIAQLRSIDAEMVELDAEIVELRERLVDRLRVQNDQLRKLLARFPA